MSRAALLPVVSLLVGLGIGFLAWGEPGRRAATHDLAETAERLRSHEEMLSRVAAGSTALAECESAQDRMAEKLEACLFSGEGGTPKPETPEGPRSGVSKFTETLDYPVPIPPKNP